MHSQLIYNQWFGKAVGFTVAFVVAPDNHTLLAACIIIGVAIGHGLDVWAVATDRPKPRFNIPDAARSQARTDSANLPAALGFLFAAVGTIAKSSGTVKPEHIKYAERLIIHLKLTTSQRAKAVAHFDTGKMGKYVFQKQAAGLLRHDNITEMRHLIVQAMVDMAAIAPADAAISNCVKIAKHLHVPGAVVAEEFSLAMAARQPKKRAKNTQQEKQQSKQHNQQRHSNSAHGSTSSQTPSGNSEAQLINAFQTLGLPPHASPSATKTAYRRLVSKHHPDKLGNTGTPRQLEAAQVKMVALREALEIIEAHHAANPS